MLVTSVADRRIVTAVGFEDAGERARLFMRLWTLKEAYVKATGRGISAPPGLKASTFELLLRSPGGKRNLPEVAAAAPFDIRFQAAQADVQRWEALLMEVSGGHSAALVVEAGRKVEGPPVPARVRVFKTVPLVSEREADAKFVRILGYGRSDE